MTLPVSYEQWALAGLTDGWIAAWWVSGSWELATLVTAGPVLVLAILTAIAGTGSGDRPISTTKENDMSKTDKNAALRATHYLEQIAAAVAEDDTEASAAISRRVENDPAAKREIFRRK